MGKKFVRRALICFCSRCMKPNGNGKDLCKKCADIMAKRKMAITRRNNRENKLD